MLKGFLFSKRKSNQKGFTLLESLLSLFINTLILLLVSSLFQTTKNMQENITHEKNSEWHIFLNQVEHDLSNKKLTTRTSQFLEFKEDITNSTFTYEFKANEVRRKKEGTGYIPLLTELRIVNFQEASGGILIQAEFGNKRVMEAYVPVEEMQKK